MEPKHHLLQDQLRAAATNDDLIDIDKLLDLVDATYDRLDPTPASAPADGPRQNPRPSPGEFYEYAASSGDIGLWEHNVPEHCIHCTDRFKEIINYPTGTDKNLESHFTDSLTEQSANDLQEKMYAIQEDDDPLIEVRAELRANEKQRRWVLIRGRVINRDSKTRQPTLVAGTLEDITRQVDHEQALEMFNQLSAEVNLTLEEKCTRALEKLKAVIGGDFVRINQLTDENKMLVKYSAGKRTGIPLGTEIPYNFTLCSQCVESESGMFSICNLEHEGFSEHPARINLGVQSYLGATIFVRGKVYGTLCFTASYPIKFTEINKNLLKVAAHWLGGQIELDEIRLSLEEAHAQAVEASQAKSDFLATMSHEIRTPLNGIMSLVELLLESPADETQKMRLHTMQRSCNNLLTVISDILDFSKIEAGKLELEDSTFNLNTTLLDVIGVFKPIADEKGVELLIKCDSSLPVYVKGDENRLKQVLNNLLSNAIKFTEEGNVSLSVATSPDDDTNVITFRIDDTGIGLNEEQLNRVFDKFTQADNSTTRRYGGTGLGLAICHQLVELMGGTITIRSTPGEGTWVTLNIPFKTGSADDLLNDSLEAEAQTIQFNAAVLVVEDNPVNQYVIEAILKTLGCQVHIASNGKEALDQLQHTAVDLILMDMQMPEMDGLVTTKKVRLEPRFLETPIIALTANALESDRQRCLEAGMDDFLLKPIIKSRLIEILEHYLH